MESLRSKLLHMTFLFGILILISSCKDEKRGLVIGKIQQASDLVVTEFVVDKVVSERRKKTYFLYLLMKPHFWLTPGQKLKQVSTSKE